MTANDITAMKPIRRFSVLVVCYGDYLDLSRRCINSFLEQRTLGEGLDRCFDLLVGANECSEATLAYLRSLYAEGLIDTLVCSRKNLNKDPMMRLLNESTKTDYILCVDDDTHVRTGWDQALLSFLRAQEPFDLAGMVCYALPPLSYWRFTSQRPWYTGRRPDTYLTWFAVGGCYLVSTALLLGHNYPDKAMVKKHADLLLGELVAEQQGTLVAFPDELLRYFSISDAPRRGSGEAQSDLRPADPVTGEAYSVSPTSFRPTRLHLEIDALHTHLTTGQALVDSNDWTAALSQFEQALNFASEVSHLGLHGQVYFLAGKACLALGNKDKAETYLRSAFSRRPDIQEISLLLARLRLDEGDLQGAIPFVRSALYVAPELGSSISIQQLTVPQLIIGLQQIGQHALASRLGNANQKVEHSEQSDRMTKTDEHLLPLPDHIRKRRSDSQAPKAPIELGMKHFRAGELESAISSLEEQLQLFPSDRVLCDALFTAYVSRADELLDANRTDDALNKYQRAIRIATFISQPERAVLVGLQAARAADRCGDTTTATSLLTHLRQLKPFNTEVLSNLGAVLSHAGRREEALSCLQFALQLDPKHRGAKRHLAELEVSEQEPL